MSLQEYRCKDGTTRMVLKDLNKLPQIFGFYVPEWQFNINLGLKASKEAAEANVGSSVGKEAKAIFDELNTINSNAYSMFAMAYLQYVSNPCDNDKALNGKIDEIHGYVNQLSDLQTRLNQLKNAPGIASVSVSGSDPRQRLVDEITRLLTPLKDHFH